VIVRFAMSGNVLKEVTDTDGVHSVFVNGRSRPAVMDNMRQRIDRGDIKAERAEAIQVR
jgi:hypothetical protein